jgi:hypothetical protein
MRMPRSCLLLTICALVAGEPVVAECVIIPQTRSERLAATALVFVGDVLKVQTVILDPEPFVYRVTFRVLEAYKGTVRGEQTFDFGTTTEDVRFEAGQRVLVYASRDLRGKFSSQCTPTRRVVLDDPELAELRRLSGSSQ